MADYEDDAGQPYQGYDPGQDPGYQTPSPEPQEAAISDVAGDESMPPQGEAAQEDVSSPLPTDEVEEQSREGPIERSMPAWLRQALTAARATFGIHEEAIPQDHENTGLPRQAGPENAAPAGLPTQAGGEEGFNDPMSGAQLPQVDTAPQSKITSESGLGDIVGAATTKAAGQATNVLNQAGSAIKSAIAPSEEERVATTTPQEGPIKQMLREYVTGERAEPNEARKQREAQLASNAGTTPLLTSDLRLAALQQAVQEGNGTPALQNLRVNQSNYRGLAAAALDNGNREAATKLWSEGSTFIPDGTHAIATPQSNGVMIMVRDSNTGQTKGTMLTDDQFRDMLHNRSGEFDHVTERGLQKMVDDVSRMPGMPPPRAGEAPGSSRNPPVPPGTPLPEGPGSATGATQPGARPGEPDALGQNAHVYAAPPTGEGKKGVPWQNQGTEAQPIWRQVDRQGGQIEDQREAQEQQQAAFAQRQQEEKNQVAEQAERTAASASMDKYIEGQQKAGNTLTPEEQEYVTAKRERAMKPVSTLGPRPAGMDQQRPAGGDGWQQGPAKEYRINPETGKPQQRQVGGRQPASGRRTRQQQLQRPRQP